VEGDTQNNSSLFLIKNVILKIDYVLFTTVMANHKSAEKSARKALKRTLINRSRMNRIRTYLRRVEDAFKAEQTQEELKNAIVAAEREIMRGAQKGVMHKRKASRKVSRLNKRLKALAA
jgi:small subunit ribosomal protein S20